MVHRCKDHNYNEYAALGINKEKALVWAFSDTVKLREGLLAALVSMMPVAAAAPRWAAVCSNLANEAEHARVLSHAPTRLITPRLAGQIQLHQNHGLDAYLL